MKKLPNLPSKLIRVALADVKKVEGMNDFYIEMGCWHGKKINCNACAVCFAGSTMVGSKESEDGNASITPDKFDKKTKQKLLALNDFRLGCLYYGLLCMGIDIPKTLPRHFNVELYGMHRVQFKTDMNKIADMLEAAGL